MPAGLDGVTDWVPAEFFRSGSDDDEEVEGPPPPAVSILSLCFGNLAGPSVGVTMPEFGGLCEGCLNEVMSTVGEGRLEMGVSIVDGREMEDGFTGSSFLPAGRGSVAKQQHNWHFQEGHVMSQHTIVYAGTPALITYYGGCTKYKMAVLAMFDCTPNRQLQTVVVMFPSITEHNCILL